MSNEDQADRIAAASARAEALQAGTLSRSEVEDALRDLDVPERITRAIADEMPTQWAEDWHWCGLCEKALAMSDRPETHEPDCLYVAALRWVAEHPQTQ